METFSQSLSEFYLTQSLLFVNSRFPGAIVENNQ